MRRTSTVTAACGSFSILAMMAWTSPGCCEDEYTNIVSSPGSAKAICPSR
jgi:hypothetical protein